MTPVNLVWISCKTPSATCFASLQPRVDEIKERQFQRLISHKSTEVDSQAGTGRIKIGGENWRAVSDKNIVIEEESLATVVRIEGSKAVVSVSENP